MRGNTLRIYERFVKMLRPVRVGTERRRTLMSNEKRLIEYREREWQALLDIQAAHQRTLRLRARALIARVVNVIIVVRNRIPRSRTVHRAAGRIRRTARAPASATDGPALPIPYVAFKACAGLRAGFSFMRMRKAPHVAHARGARR